MIGREAGICYKADTTDDDKNFRRGMDCLDSGHGRTFEFPDVYMVLSGYSARVIREWYTHIGGAPTRLQESTRYIDYEHGFEYVIPPSISKSAIANALYSSMMENIQKHLTALDELGIPREDSAMGLPLGMETGVVCKSNLRTLIDMSHQRMCTRAYWEYRELFSDLIKALGEYSPEWKLVVGEYFEPKCRYLGYCPERRSCGIKPGKEQK